MTISSSSMPKVRSVKAGGERLEEVGWEFLGGWEGKGEGKDGRR